MALSNKAELFAKDAHRGTNHLYDGMPYEYHLEQVVSAANKYLHLIPIQDHETVLAACWAHDTIEDCRVTYNDVKAELGEDVAEIVYALTNEKGKTRKERAGSIYYRGIWNVRYAGFVKACDRLANIIHSVTRNCRNASVYSTEQESFKDYLYTPEYKEIFDEMDFYLATLK
jgi:(p)ppGpp synthase/HD superfamily hydrolase